MSGPDCDKCGEYFLDCHCEELEASLERLPSGKYIEVFMYDDEQMRDVLGKFKKKKFSVYPSTSANQESS